MLQVKNCAICHGKIIKSNNLRYITYFGDVVVYMIDSAVTTLDVVDLTFFSKVTQCPLLPVGPAPGGSEPDGLNLLPSVSLPAVPVHHNITNTAFPQLQ